MTAEILVVVVFPALLALAAAWDFASYTIPNTLPVVFLAAFAAFAIAAGMPMHALGFHVLAGFLALALGFALFAFGFIGGGDAKLVAAIVLWLGFQDLGSYALIATVMGGGLTLALLALRRMPLPALLSGQPWLLRLHDVRSGVPYGVALAAGALFILPQSEIFRIAANA